MSKISEQTSPSAGSYAGRPQQFRFQEKTDQRLAVLADSLQALLSKQHKLAAILRTHTLAGLQAFPRGSLFDARW